MGDITVASRWSSDQAPNITDSIGAAAGELGCQYHPGSPVGVLNQSGHRKGWLHAVVGRKALQKESSFAFRAARIVLQLGCSKRVMANVMCNAMYSNHQTGTAVSPARTLTCNSPRTTALREKHAKGPARTRTTLWYRVPRAPKRFHLFCDVARRAPAAPCSPQQ